VITLSKLDLEQQFQKEIRKFSNQAFDIVQEALEEEAESLKNQLAAITPVGPRGKFKAGWKKKKYPNHMYVYNDALGSNNVPLSNITEYSRRGPHPFILSAFERAKSSIQQSLIQRISKKLRRK
jgi:hypothetical protein